MLESEMHETIEKAKAMFKEKPDVYTSNSDVKFKCDSHKIKTINKKLYRSKWLFCVEILGNRIFCEEIIPYSEHLNITFKFVVDKETYLEELKVILYSQQLGTNNIGKRIRIVLHEEVVPLTSSKIVAPGDTCNIENFTIDFDFPDDILDCCHSIHFDVEDNGGVV